MVCSAEIVPMKQFFMYASFAVVLSIRTDLPPSGQNTYYSNFKVSVPTETPTLFGMSVKGYVIIEDKVKPNQFLAEILRQYNVPPHLIRQASLLPREVFDVRRLVPNKKITLICHNDSLHTPKVLVYEPNAIDYIVFNLDERLTVETCKREVEIIEREISGVIESSLFQTIAQMGISYELTNRVVDILAWQVDFQRLNRGDEIKIIYEDKRVEGQSIGIGEIKGIYFRYGEKTVYAIPFDQGEGVEYFNADGNSLRKALLKYPIEFTRISSRYSLRRFHPVLKVNRPHLGTDFAAPAGTPVRSVGDGMVTEAGYTANNGNYVKIRHNSTYTTQYLHLSRIAPGIRRGVSVKQGQWIGNVGSTGLATGPHLCYRFWKNDKQVDALKVELPSAQPVKSEYREVFDRIKEETINRLNAIPAARPYFYASAS